ncbi:MAG: hypothetical protein DLM64_12205 [Solirubrobacterales bacterium]|nr:MAG: hypothetical protein DLM64_12205 [Solirubrobacterales bacterium]
MRGRCLAWERPLLVAIVIATAVAGCGGARAHRGAGSSSSGSAAAPFRWLVPTQGAQPTTAQENTHAGTETWRLRGPAADVGGLAHGSVAGYVAEQTLAPGQVQRIYASAPGARRIRIRVFRIGWYGGRGGREVLVSRALRAATQPPCVHRYATGLTECDWHPALSFTIPSALASGVYIAKLSAPTGESDCIFVVRAAHPQPLLAQLPTATYEAYNAWGGDSLYPGGADRVGATGTTQGVEVSYDRPYDSVTGAGQFFARDVAMVRFLERYGYPVSYTTSESVDQLPGQLGGHRALIDFGHSEYWSARQAQAFASVRDAGTSLLFFGSDTLAWRVRYAPASPAASEAGQPDHSLVSYKEHFGSDPDQTNPTGPFSDRGAALTGSAYLGCITPRVSEPGPPAYRYYAWSPAPTLAPQWLFAGAGVTARTRIAGIVGYELDQRTDASPPAARVIGGGSAPCMAAGASEPGDPVPGTGDGLAQSTLYTARSGALVFDTGTLGWELGLEPVASASPDAPRAPDPRVVAITRNLLGHVLGAAQRPGR